MSTNTTQDYLNLITSQHQGKPNFVAMITADVSPMVQVQALLAAMISLFDVDVAIGDQLDIIGKWVGISRNVSIPISGIFFTWDGLASLGWDYGIWPDPSNPNTITTLPDNNYRILIKAKIASNHWDGTTEGAYAIWNILFPTLNLLLQDNQDMSIVVAIQGSVPDALTLALLVGGYLPLKPEGVHINEYIVPIDTNLLFAWDVESPYLAGWDTGSWGSELLPV